MSFESHASLHFSSARSFGTAKKLPPKPLPSVWTIRMEHKNSLFCDVAKISLKYVRQSIQSKYDVVESTKIVGAGVEIFAAIHLLIAFVRTTPMLCVMTKEWYFDRNYCQNGIPRPARRRLTVRALRCINLSAPTTAFVCRCFVAAGGIR